MDRHDEERDELERLLRASRAEPSPELMQRVTSRLNVRRARAKSLRITLAFALSTAMLTGGALAAKYSSAGNVSKKAVQTRSAKPAHHQYNPNCDHRWRKDKHGRWWRQDEKGKWWRHDQRGKWSNHRSPVWKCIEHPKPPKPKPKPRWEPPHTKPKPKGKPHYSKPKNSTPTRNVRYTRGPNR